MKQLIKEGKNDKARKVIDLAMKKMPFEYYGYYVMLDDFVDGYYKLNDISNARQLSAKIIKKYQENLDYYSKLSIPEQNDIHMDIFNDIYKYKGQIDIMKENNDNGQYGPAHDTFLSYTKRFSKLYDIHHFEKEK